MWRDSLESTRNTRSSCFFLPVYLSVENFVLRVILIKEMANCPEIRPLKRRFSLKCLISFLVISLLLFDLYLKKKTENKTEQREIKTNKKIII